MDVKLRENVLSSILKLFSSEVDDIIELNKPTFICTTNQHNAISICCHHYFNCRQQFEEKLFV